MTRRGLADIASGTRLELHRAISPAALGVDDGHWVPATVERIVRSFYADDRRDPIRLDADIVGASATLALTKVDEGVLWRRAPSRRSIGSIAPGDCMEVRSTALGGLGRSWVAVFVVGRTATYGTPDHRSVALNVRWHEGVVIHERHLMLYDRDHGSSWRWSAMAETARPIAPFPADWEAA